MKKVILAGCCLLGLFFQSRSQNINLSWATQIEAPQAIWHYDMCSDANGFVYTTGGFYDTADFNPGPGQYLLLSAGNYNVYVSKQDASGDIVWARNLGGTASDFGYTVATDNAGNVYVGGYFNGLADFDPGPGIYNMNAAAGAQAYIVKLDAGGNFVWAKQIEGTSVSNAIDIVVDQLQQVVVSGVFQHNADLDPGPAAFNVSSNGMNDIFLLKMDASGNFLWATQTGGKETDFVHEIASDNLGNVYSTGHFRATVDFDPGVGLLNIASAGAEDNYVAKYDGSGSLVWVKTTGGTNGDFSFSLATDNAGNVYYGANFSGTCDMDPGPGVFNLTAAAQTDVAISKLDASGNLVWAKQIAGTGSDNVKSLRLDALGNVYLFGDFNGQTDFDPGPGIFNLTGWLDMFVCKLNNSGNFVQAFGVGGISWEESRSLAVDASGNLYISGTFNDLVDFDPGAGNFILDAGAEKNAFVTKFTQSFPLPANLINFTGRQQKGHVVLNWACEEEKGLRHYTIQKSSDAQGWTDLQSINCKGSSTQYEIVDQDLRPGPVYYRLAVHDRDGHIHYSAIVKLSIFDADEIAFGPNPTKNVIYFEREYDFSVQDTYGHVLDFQAASSQLDLRNLFSGVYLVQVSSKGQLIKTIRVQRID